MKKIVIVGNGAGGIFCAAAIKKQLPNLEVVIVYDPDKKHIGVGESLAFNGPDFMKNVLGMDNELDWMRESSSAFKFGVKWLGFDGNDQVGYVNTAPLNLSYKVVENSIMESWYHHYYHNDKNSLYDIWAYCREKNLVSSLNPQTDLGETHQFLVDNKSPVNINGTRRMSHHAGYSYHINAENIRTVVRKRVGIPAGVKEIPIPIQEVISSNGKIDHLTLITGEKVTADLFIDCTGFAKLLFKELDVEFEHADGYANNTALVGNYNYQDTEEHNSWTLLAAMDYGWRFSISMNHRSGEGYQYNSAIFSNEDRLVDEYERKTGRPGNILRKIAWTPGYYKNAFSGNCIALGLSHGFIDVFDSNNFSTTLLFIKKIIAGIKDDPTTEFKWRDSFNWTVKEITEDIKFRIQCAFHLAPKNNTEYWHAMKEYAIKFNTKEKLLDAIFSERKKGRLSHQNNAYSQHTFLNTAIYYGIPFKTPDDWNVSPETVELALNLFEFIKNKGKLQSKYAPTSGEFYQALFSDATLEPERNSEPPQLFQDFLS
jgi:tryptophan halogenase